MTDELNEIRPAAEVEDEYIAKRLKRPRVYTEDWHVPMVQLLADKGLTDEELAKVFCVTRQTLHNWYDNFPEFREARQLGAILPNAAVERSLLHRALGYTAVEQVLLPVTKNGEKTYEIFQVTKQFPPDSTACIYWLKNRIPGRWRQNPPAGNEEEIPGAVEVTVVDASKQKNAHTK